jgi:hypothetical protein
MTVGAAVGLRRMWPGVAVALAALLWWPVGFWGVDKWLHAPLRALEGDVVVLSATASAAVVAMLVRAPWPRLAVIAGCSAVAWVLSAPAADTAPDEREVLLLLLGGAAVAGALVGRRGSAGPLQCATVLAIVAGLTQATWPTGAALAVALALPFAVASWERAAPTLLSVMRLLATWLLVSISAMALRHGWDVLHPGMQAGSKRNELRLVAEAAWDFLRTQWRTAAEALLAAHVPWFWGAAALALLVVGVRVVAVLVGGRASPTSRSGRLAGVLTSGAPRR